VLNKGLKLELWIYTDLQKLGGRTEFDMRTESNWYGRLPIRLQTTSGRIVVFPVELRRMTFELLEAWVASRRAPGRELTNSGSSPP